ncbi:ATP-grasp domain-containing protein [Microcoleus sp. D2_18a_B4]|uniref:ATP-grasp domain-containing protein n=1 Tax=Microcoleus sp. D2_18a_B4 TaxID=3055329 RepID=UPI002FD2A628
MSEFNILFTSAGRRVSLIQAFKKTLKDMGLTGSIVTTDLQNNAPASFISDFNERVSRVNDPNYINKLKEICQKYEIKLLIPLIDTELNTLAFHKEEFQKLGVTIVVSSSETTGICNDKTKTYEFFKKMGVPTPEILDADEILADSQAKYPFLLKPADGSASVGVTKIKNAKELAFFKDYIPNAIVQELLVGEEYTLDILVDFQGEVRSVVPRLRIETRAGEISKGVTVKNSALIAAGKKVVDTLPGALGCITVQCFLLPSGDIKFTEINPRFGGGYPLSFAAGANFPRWIIEMILGKNPEISIDGWQEDVVMLRYDEAIFLSQEKRGF